MTRGEACIRHRAVFAPLLFCFISMLSTRHCGTNLSPLLSCAEDLTLRPQMGLYSAIKLLKRKLKQNRTPRVDLTVMRLCTYRKHDKDINMNTHKGRGDVTAQQKVVSTYKPKITLQRNQPCPLPISNIQTLELQQNKCLLLDPLVCADSVTAAQADQHAKADPTITLNLREMKLKELPSLFDSSALPLPTVPGHSLLSTSQQKKEGSQLSVLECTKTSRPNRILWQI